MVRCAAIRSMIFYKSGLLTCKSAQPSSFWISARIGRSHVPGLDRCYLISAKTAYWLLSNSVKYKFLYTRWRAANWIRYDLDLRK